MYKFSDKDVEFLKRIKENYDNDNDEKFKVKDKLKLTNFLIDDVGILKEDAFNFYFGDEFEQNSFIYPFTRIIDFEDGTW